MNNMQMFTFPSPKNITMSNIISKTVKLKENTQCVQFDAAPAKTCNVYFHLSALKE